MQSSAARTQSTAGALADSLYALFIHMVSTTTHVMSDLDLNVPQIKAMHVLEGAGDELAVGEFAERLGISLPAASRSVDALVQRGLAERREDDRDRRMKRVGITREGRATVRRIHETRRAALARLVDELEPSQRDALAAALHPLTERIAR